MSNHNPTQFERVARRVFLFLATPRGRLALFLVSAFGLSAAIWLDERFRGLVAPTHEDMWLVIELGVILGLLAFVTSQVRRLFGLEQRENHFDWWEGLDLVWTMVSFGIPLTTVYVWCLHIHVWMLLPFFAMVTVEYPIFLLHRWCSGRSETPLTNPGVQRVRP